MSLPSEQKTKTLISYVGGYGSADAQREAEVWNKTGTQLSCTLK